MTPRFTEGLADKGMGEVVGRDAGGGDSSLIMSDSLELYESMEMSSEFTDQSSSSSESSMRCVVDPVWSL